MVHQLAVAFPSMAAASAGAAVGPVVSAVIAERGWGTGNTVVRPVVLDAASEAQGRGAVRSSCLVVETDDFP